MPAAPGGDLAPARGRQRAGPADARREHGDLARDRRRSRTRAAGRAGRRRPAAAPTPPARARPQPAPQPDRPRSPSSSSARSASQPGSRSSSPHAHHTASASRPRPRATSRPAAMHGDGGQLEPARMHGGMLTKGHRPLRTGTRRTLSASADSIPAIVVPAVGGAATNFTTNVWSDAHASLDPRRGRLSGMADGDAVLGTRARRGGRRQLRPPALGRRDGRRLADADRVAGRAHRGLAGGIAASGSPPYVGDLAEDTVRGRRRGRLPARHDHPLRRAAERAVVDAQRRPRRRRPSTTTSSAR